MLIVNSVPEASSGIVWKLGKTVALTFLDGVPYDTILGRGILTTGQTPANKDSVPQRPQISWDPTYAHER